MEIKVGDKVRVIATVEQLTTINIPFAEAKLLCSMPSIVLWSNVSVGVFVLGNTSWSMPKAFVTKQPIQLMLPFGAGCV